MTDSSRISPTAHYTGFVWYRNRMAHPALGTRAGWALFQLLRPANALYRVAGGPTLEQMLLVRHRLIDDRLAHAIETGRIGQVIEVAAGLSPRGVEFARRYPELIYVEGDLPGMCARKRRALLDAGVLSDRHHVVELDALADGGPRSLEVVAGRRLEPGRGTAVITEGLLSYFDRPTVEAMWRRFAGLLRDGGGLYLSDLHLSREVGGLRGARAFQAALSLFARGGVHIHYSDADACESALRDAGFGRVELHRGADHAGRLGLDAGASSGVVRVIEASVGPDRVV